ncbi:metal/formaldehyde-sensitive transcriptional repressor [Herbaspirillum sp.]|uniref:metal/formaldehyde-sensitive transcriptional repressor n=1 Tax=Herbaspirillum sp. TaxID=1890675 RepID=UPI0031E32901
MHTIHEKPKLLARVRRMQGQLRALETQLEQEGDCIEILQQIAAIRGAANGLMSTIIEGHMRDHVVREAKEELREEEAKVVLQVVKSYLK